MHLKQLGLLLPTLKVPRSVKGIGRRDLHKKYYRKTPRREKKSDVKIVTDIKIRNHSC